MPKPLEKKVKGKRLVKGDTMRPAKKIPPFKKCISSVAQLVKLPECWANPESQYEDFLRERIQEKNSKLESVRLQELSRCAEVERQRKKQDTKPFTYSFTGERLDIGKAGSSQKIILPSYRLMGPS